MSNLVAKVAKNARGRASDSPEVRISKTLSYILRHGAEKEGLKIRPDGYVRISELLARPKLNGVDLAMIQQIVAKNDKQRYQLLEAADDTAESSEGVIWWIRANQGHTLKVDALELQPITSPQELPRAIHGTSLKAWKSICEHPSPLPQMCSLTNLDVVFICGLAKEGLSKMKRNHVHLATGLPSSGVKSGMRAGSQVLIYIDVPKAMEAGLKFYLSANGVVLTEGNENGIIPIDLFERVEFVNTKEDPPQSSKTETLAPQ